MIDTMLISGDHAPDSGIAVFVDEFLRDPHWVRRKVDTISFLDYDTLLWRTTLDLEMSKLTEFTNKLSFEPCWPYIPLAFLNKRLLAKFDLRDASGAALPVVPREVDSYFGWSFLCAKAAAALGVDMEGTNPVVRSHIRKIVTNFPNIDDDIDGESFESWSFPLVWAEPIVSEWFQLLDNDTFTRFLLDFTFNYILLTQLPFLPAVQIVKFSHYQTVNLNSATTSALLQLDAAEFRVEAPSIGWGRSYHFQLEPPSEMTITELYLIRPKAIDKAQVSKDAYEVQIGNGFGQIHTTGAIKPDRFEIKLLMRVAIPGYLRSLWLSTVFSATVLLFGDIFLQRLQNAVSNSSEAPVALLLVAPSIITAYLVRPGEHAIASTLMRVLRYLAGFSGILTFIAAAVLVLGWENQSLRVIWNSLATFATLDALIFSIGMVKNRNDTAKSRKLAGKTIRDYVQDVPIKIEIPPCI